MKLTNKFNLPQTVDIHQRCDHNQVFLGGKNGSSQSSETGCY